MENTPNTQIPPPSSPQVFANPTKEESKFKQFLSKWVLNVRVIFILLGIVILFEIFQAYKIFTTPIDKANLTPKFQNLSDGKIVLASDGNSYEVDENIEVIIRISTGGFSTDGADVVINYDPNMLELSSTPIEKGDLYSDYPGTNVDAKAGEILVSGIATSSGEGYNGTGNFATINFVAKKIGKTTIKVKYKDGDTTDSNILESSSSKDILKQVYNLDVNIGEEVSDESISEVDLCETFTQICKDESGKSGTQLCSQGRSKNNECIWDPQYTTTCGECKVD